MPETHRDDAARRDQRALIAKMTAPGTTLAEREALDRELRDLRAQAALEAVESLHSKVAHQANPAPGSWWGPETTTESDWLSTVGSAVEGSEMARQVVSDAREWFDRVPAHVRENEDEFTTQAQGVASRTAGRYGYQAPVAVAAFVAAARRLAGFKTEGYGFDPELPAGYQDADIEMAELAEEARLFQRWKEDLDFEARNAYGKNLADFGVTDTALQEAYYVDESPADLTALDDVLEMSGVDLSTVGAKQAAQTHKTPFIRITSKPNKGGRFDVTLVHDSVTVELIHQSFNKAEAVAYAEQVAKERGIEVQDRHLIEGTQKESKKVTVTWQRASDTEYDAVLGDRVASVFQDGDQVAWEVVRNGEVEESGRVSRPHEARVAAEQALAGNGHPDHEAYEDFMEKVQEGVDPKYEGYEASRKGFEEWKRDREEDRAGV